VLLLLHKSCQPDLVLLRRSNKFKPHSVIFNPAHDGQRDIQWDMVIGYEYTEVHGIPTFHHLLGSLELAPREGDITDPAFADSHLPRIDDTAFE